MSEAPAELWLRLERNGAYQSTTDDDDGAVRYVRADLYDKRMAEPVNQEPLGELGTDYPR